jgi:beta-glucosidase
MSFPHDVGQIPISSNGLPAGRPFDPDNKYTSKYLDVANTPQYPFGYGLSCTTFARSNLHLPAGSVSTAGTLTVTADLTSTGNRAGDDVAQLRIHGSGTSILQPVRRLDGCQRVTLAPGQTQTVTFTLGPPTWASATIRDSSPSNLAASTCTSATVHWPACTTGSPCADRSASVQYWG